MLVSSFQFPWIHVHVIATRETEQWISQSVAGADKYIQLCPQPRAI
jgi:hypothetical protein